MSRAMHVLSAAILALAATQAQAVERIVTFTGQIPRTNAFFAYCQGSSCPLTESQQAFFSGINTGTTFDFTFRYDTDTTGTDNVFAADLVSGRVGSYTDFSGFTPTVRLSATSGGGDMMMFSLDRLDLHVAAANARFTSGVYFSLIDNQGALFGTALPQDFDPATLEQKNAEFRVTSRYGYNYRYFVAPSIVNTTGAPTVDPGAVGAVPEPATWALMMLGFGAAGAALRRRSTSIVTVHA